MKHRTFVIIVLLLVVLAVVSSAYTPSVEPFVTSWHTLGGDCLADRAQGDIIVKADWYCNPVRGDYIRSLPSMDTVDSRVTNEQASTNEGSDNGNDNPTVQTEDNTPPTTPPVVSNPPVEHVQKDKHPNNGGGNGSELDSNGNDRDPNTNQHANKHD